MMKSTAGAQCVTAMTRLKLISAMSGRVSWPATAWIHRGESSHRRSHPGIPNSRSGGATSEMSVCWTMCTENR